jgi:hypothetical protein
MNDSPLDNNNFDKNNENSSINYKSEKSKDLERLNEKKSNSFKSDNIINKSNNDSLIKNQISGEKISQEFNDDKSLSENEEEKYEVLKKKYKELKEENKNLKEELRKNELIIEQNNNDIILLRSSIENQFFKNNDLIKYITTENIIDFIKLKNENEQFKKELVLSQALVNSLQTENLGLIQAKEENSELVNIETDDFLSNSENKVYELNSDNNGENEIIKELNKENNVLKKLVQEATVKLNDVLMNQKSNKILYEEKDILNYQLKEKNDIINEYEEKLTFFNTYITEIKYSFNKLKNYIINSINAYNKLANEDLNSLLSNSFSQNVMKLSMQIASLDEIEKYNLETNPELDLHNIINELLYSINDEFIILYEKVFQTNNYYKESNNKINELEAKIRQIKINNELNNNNEIMKLKDEYVKTIVKLNYELSSKENDNYFFKENIISIKQNLDDVINIFSLLIKVFDNNNEINLSNYLKNFLENIKEKMNMINEREEIIKKILKNNHKIKNLKLENKNVENFVFYDDNYINNIIKDFQEKINEKENQIVINKEQINSLLS